MTTHRWLSVAAYMGSIVAANWLTSTIGLVPISFGLLVTAGTFAAGAALVLRDRVDSTGGRKLVFAAIAAGAVLSYALASPAIAAASAIAFTFSELVDWAVFAPMKNCTLPGAVLVSSIVAAPVDTVLFLHLAGFPVTPQAVAGQLLVKTALAGLVAAAMAIRLRRAT